MSCCFAPPPVAEAVGPNDVAELVLKVTLPDTARRCGVLIAEGPSSRPASSVSARAADCPKPSRSLTGRVRGWGH